MIDKSKNTISFQGIAGAHSDMACKLAYPYYNTLPCDSFEEAFEKVENGEAALAHIPIENSNAGRVAEIHNLLPTTSLSIVGEFFHEVSHQLLAIKDTKIENIKTVYSHPQALMQCQKKCAELGLEAKPYFDTAAAAKYVSEKNDFTIAALASNLAGELYGLQSLKVDMQDSDNYTLFITLSKQPIDIIPETKHVLTTLLFTTRNIAAGLYKALGGFATNNVNILKLESYIPNYLSGEAQFLITFEGYPDRRNVQSALEELGFFTKNVKLLGVYEADSKRYPKKIEEAYT